MWHCYGANAALQRDDQDDPCCISKVERINEYFYDDPTRKCIETLVVISIEKFYRPLPSGIFI